MVQRDSRLQILGLLCSYVRLQGPHLYQVLQTSLLDNLLRCLENDTSTTVISLALTVLVMFMPHLCNSLGSYLPRLFIVFTRVLCWDKFGIVRLEDKFTNLDAYSRTSTPLSSEIHEDTVGDSAWQTLHSSFEYASSTTPDVSDYFSFLYGLYPINFLSFIREPYKFLDRVAYKDIDQLDIEEETIRQRTEFYRQRHILHPNFLTLTAETELTDQSRWMKVEPADVTAQCIGLVNKNVLAEDVKKSMRIERFDSIPESLIPTEEIPIESLLSQRDDYSPNDDITEHDHYFALPSPDNDNIDGNPQLNPGQSVSTARIGPFSRHLKSLGSPTNLGYSQSEDSRLWDMLKLQEQLHNSMSKPDDGISSLHGMLSHSTGTPVYPGSLAASPRLDAYVHSLSQNTVPRSPALRPAASDAQETIAYLQREVMLLKNDLNFERYLKQQHSSHIGHLQRKHIKESTAEAETQNLINTNKNLKAKLEEAKKAYTAARQEAKQSKSQAKKWEVELSTKIRTLREEQKAWRQDEEVTKKALEAAREEAENLRKLLAESEAEGLRSNQKLQIMKAEMEEVDKLRSFVDHLSSKLVDYERRSDEFEAQRHREEGAIAQVECMKLRLVSCEKELLKLQEYVE
jgi:solute carrier family 25 protein 16